VEYDTSYPKEEITNEYNIYVEWQYEKMPWNEICARVLEVFGLPGDRYVTTSSTQHLVIKFKSEKDYTLCQIMLSEYL
jgi:hypothetical protein